MSEQPIPAIVPRDTSKPETITSYVREVGTFTVRCWDDVLDRSLVVDRGNRAACQYAHDKNLKVTITITPEGKGIWRGTVEKL